VNQEDESYPPLTDNNRTAGTVTYTQQPQTPAEEDGESTFGGHFRPSRLNRTGLKGGETITPRGLRREEKGGGKESRL